MPRLHRLPLPGIALLFAALVAGPAATCAAGTLTLAGAWERVRAAHPSFAAADAAIAADEAAAAQAGRGLNPELVLDVENFAGSGEFAGFDGAELTLLAAQTWTLGGKPALRRAEAEAAVRGARFAAAVSTQGLEAELTRTFVAVLGAQRRVALADTAVAVATRDLAAVGRRVDAGAESRLASQRSHLAAADARRAAARARDELGGARRRLAILWGGDASALPPAVGDLDSLVLAPAWDDVAAAADSCPAVRLADLARERADAAVDVARSLGSSDVTTAAGWRHFRGSGDNALVASVALPLPLRDTNRDGVRAARGEAARAAADVEAVRFRVRAEVADVWNRLTTSRADVETIRGEILPAAVAAMAEAQHAYAVGRFSLTDMLAVRRDWAAWEAELVDALVRHHTAAADLSALLGAPTFTPVFSPEVSR